MLKIGITSSLFIFGIVLALLSVLNLNVFGFTVKLPGFNEVLANTSADPGSSASAQNDSSRSAVAADPNIKSVEAAPAEYKEPSEKNSSIEPTVEMVYSVTTSRTERTEILSKALSSGSLKALQYLRPEFLNTDPEFRTELLPVMKRRADESLLKRFSEDDWKGWLNSGTVLGGKPTAAFMYGIDVYLVNHELGRFVITSGYLFHRAWAQASAGELFDPVKEISKLTQDGVRMHREVAAGISWGDLIDPAAANDQIVLGFLDTIRFRLIERALNPNSNNDMRAVNLLLSLPDAPLPDSTVKAVGSFIRRISADEDHSIRDSLVGAEHESLSLSRLATHHPQLKTPIAYLLLAVALDFHERGERADAATAAKFAREFDPAVLTEDELSLFTGNRTAAKPAAAEPPASAGDNGNLPQSVASAPRHASGIELGRTPQNPDLSEAIEDHQEQEKPEAAPVRQGLKIDVGPSRTAGGKTETSPTVPFGLIILGFVLLAGAGLGFRFLLKKFQDRFGEAEFNDLSKGQANADFTLGDGIDVLQGNRPPR